VAREKFRAEARGRMSRDEAIEAINSSETFSANEKEFLFKMLNESLIELYRDYDTPKEVRICVNKKALGFFMGLNFL